jgi:hypothetical protein
MSQPAPDFTALRKEGGSFTVTAETFDAYRAWRDMQVCQWCGTRFADRKDGDMWITETECFKCVDHPQRLAASGKTPLTQEHTAMRALLQQIADAPCDHGEQPFCPRNEAYRLLKTIKEG